MDFAFYHADPPPSLLGRAVQPLRRLFRRIQRPYFYRLRDLIAHLFHQQQAISHRCDELAAHIHAVDAALRDRVEAERTPLQPQAFTADYLALTRRLAQLEDLLIDLHARTPAAAPVPAAPEVDLAAFARRLDALEESVAQLSAASQLDAVLPLYSDAQRRQVS
jgi:hypothetical protein